MSDPRAAETARASTGFWCRSAAYAWLAFLAGGATLLWALRNGRTLLYGDATAHLAIARRMVDSATPGLSQWGTVWLPLPHLLMAPLTLVPGWWKSGLAGALPALLALVLGTWLMHRIAARLWGRVAAAWAAAFYALNPSLLYLSAVPMTESMYLAAFLGLVERCAAYADDPRPAIVWQAAAWGLAAAMTRYDGWFVLPFALLALGIASGRAAARSQASAAGLPPAAVRPRSGGLWPATWRFCLLTGLGPVFWFWFNAHYFKNPLAFAEGPGSARQIYLSALRHGGSRYPGDHAILTAALYYLKTVILTCGVPLALLALVGLLVWLAHLRKHPGSLRRRPAAWLLLLPLPWYLWAMWSGNVPIFLPQYWPHGYYNLRYGVELLPAVAVFSSLIVAALAFHARRLIWPQVRMGVALGLAILCAGGYAAMLAGQGPPAYAEAVHNAPARRQMEHAIARALEPWRPGERILMYFGKYPGAIADDGIAVRDLIQESNYNLWRDALAAPQRYVNWVVLEQGGPADSAIDRSALRRYFRKVAALQAPGQPDVWVFQRR